MSLASPFLVTLGLVVASLLLIGLMELLPDRRLAVLAVVTMAIACAIVGWTVLQV
jgi:hypothetical protein